MHKHRIAIVVICVILVALLGVLSIPLMQRHANLGLDLQGGVMVRLEAPQGTSDEDMRIAVDIINARVNALGVAEPDVRREGDNRVVVELAGLEDPEQAVRMIGTTAKLQFVRMDNQEIILEGNQLNKATAQHNTEAINPNERFGVSLTFDTEGARAFADVTQELVAAYPAGDPQRIIAIILDDEVISQPIVTEAVGDGNAVISGSFQSLSDAQELATLLNSGALPVELTILEQQTVGPQLGPDSIQKSLNAALIGVVLLAIFILAIYRGLGLVALFSLALYGILLSGSLVLIGSTITLQVIAAFLLSVGMAVDSNVLIYERIKEELRTGKSIRVAANAGFKKAFATILDSQVTTLIAGVVLIILGTGAVRGFAVTLCIGIIISLFTAITFTRFILRYLVLSGAVRSTRFFGVGRAE